MGGFFFGRKQIEQEPIVLEKEYYIYIELGKFPV